MSETKFIFVNRRKGDDRRQDVDPCSNMPLDLYHRKRRKSTERRDTSRSLSDDYYAYMQKIMSDSTGSNAEQA
ncbi:hypothetical protein WKI13_08760 [Teredinibacter turnerae]|uniref:hypothetical protein n=1 Tax=Teredinibacter turnerae TaxID=2426 RepID=UPI00035C927D|nr:hypothetical protein [Teredinibacter turnerae]